MNNTNHIIKLIGISSLYLFHPEQGKGEETPNIILIFTDDHGYGDLSFSGGKDIYTPHIDRLFQSGMCFSNFYSNCTVSSPTRASLLTGRYPDMVGVPGVIRPVEDNCWGYFKEDIPSLPDMLKKANYQTALIGKWHLGEESPNLPNERGFDLFKGFLSGMMDDYYTHQRMGKNCLRINNEEIRQEGHATTVFTDWAIEYLKESQKTSEPFFLYLAYNAPHFPIQPPDEWYDKVMLREPGISGKRAKNVALVEHLDYEIGRLLETLDQLELAENTLIIFSSDNGGSLSHGASNGELKGGKHDLYEGGIKVNTCFTWKKKIKPATECNQLSLTMDIFPTLCRIAGISIEHEIDGMDLFPFLAGEKNRSEQRMIYFMYRDGGANGGHCIYTVRDTIYKYVMNSPFEPANLYNIAQDPFERYPLNNEILSNQMKKNVSKQILRSGSIPWQKKKGENDGKKE